MVRSDYSGYLPALRTRTDYFDYFDGYVADRFPELASLRSEGGLEKTYMLETVGGRFELPSLDDIFKRSGHSLERVADEDALFRIVEPSGGRTLGLLESLRDRYLVVYTLLPADQSDKWIRQLVQTNPYLDRLWLSAHVFAHVWSFVARTTNPMRYSRLTFEHEALYEVQDHSDDAQSPVPAHLRNDELLQERRASRFSMVDRVSVITEKLRPLRETYTPLYSITQLRIPSDGRGGHDFYYNGKVTNRSDSFIQHRQSVDFVIGLYERLTAAAEERLWVSASSKDAQRSEGFVLRGSTVTLLFGEPLELPTFNRWLISLFGNRRNRFRLSGYPRWQGPAKLQANAIDNHLWQPLFLEATPSGISAVLPFGTCGNTVNRLITNVQRYVDPAVTAWIGDVPYPTVIADALRAA